MICMDTTQISRRTRPLVSFVDSGDLEQAIARLPTRAALNTASAGPDWSILTCGGFDAFFTRLEATDTRERPSVRALQAAGLAPIVHLEVTRA